MNRLREIIDRMRSGETAGRSAWLVLLGGMAVSTGLALWFGRNTSFSTDEYAWLSASPSLDLSGAFDEHLGHLVLVPRLVYKLIFETAGTGYIPFRMLALGSVFLASALLFVWAKKRVPDFVALAPCLVLLVFPSDIWHYLAGNGFTVMFAVACGLAAWLAFERPGPGWDVVACGLLLLGTLTYTTALPFAAGLAFVCLLDRSNRGRAWVGLLPLFGYAAWRVWSGADAAEPIQGGTEWTNLMLLPAWTFQSVGGILSALSGLHFDFANESTVPPGELAGPALALVAFLALGYRMNRRRVGFWFWVSAFSALALFASQVLVWSPEGRSPAEPRYLYPGAVMLLLVMTEAARGIRWTRTAFVSVWVVAAISLMTSLALLKHNTDWLGLWADQARADVTAIAILEETGRGGDVAGQPRQRMLPSFEASGADSYGYLGFTDSEVAANPWIAEWVDDFLVKSIPGAGGAPGTTLCRTVRGLDAGGGLEWFLDGKSGRISVCAGP